MLIKESTLRKLIQEVLLLEAIYKQKDLMTLSPELTNIISQQFELIEPTASLANEKSPGRFFIDILYQCMRELLGEFDPVADANDKRFLEKVENICVQLIILFQQKDVTSSTVQTGEVFRDYIYSFMLKPKEFVVKDYEDRPITDMITKLRYVYNYVMNRSKISGPERIMKFINIIKSRETYYPFGKDLVDGKYLVVCPLNMMSSIFWARTNAEAKNIILPDQDDPKWCTARFTGGNLFNTYFIGGGTNLFYFLPVDDVTGREKFCVGLTKMKDEKKENAAPYLVIGGYTTVDFNNYPIIMQQHTVNEKVLKSISNKLNVSESVLNNLVDVMEHKEPMDRYKYVSLLDLEQFVAATNLDTIDVLNIKQQVEQTIEIYRNPEYLKRGYKADPKILKYVDKKWDEWQAAGVNISLLYLPESKKISDPNVIMQMIDSKTKDKTHPLIYATDDIKNNPDIVMYAILNDENIDTDKFSGFTYRESIKSGYISEHFASDLNFINILIKEFFKNFNKEKALKSFNNIFLRLSPTLQTNPAILTYISQYKDMLLTKLKTTNDLAITYNSLPNNFINDIEFATVALESCKDSYEFSLIYQAMPTDFKKNKKLIIDVLQKYLDTNTGPKDIRGSHGNNAIPLQALDEELLFDLDVIFYALKYISNTPSVFGAFKNILGINKRDNKSHNILENYEFLKKISIEAPDILEKLCIEEYQNSYYRVLSSKQLLNLCAYIYFCSNSSYNVLSSLIDTDIFNSIKVELDKLLEIDPNNGKYVNEEYFQKAFAYSNSLNNITYSNGRISSGLQTEGRHTRKLIMTESQLKRLIFRYL